MAHTRKAATAASGCYQRINKKQNKQREEGRRGGGLRIRLTYG